MLSIKFITNRSQQLIDSLFVGFALAGTSLISWGINTPLLAAMDVTLIPMGGAVGNAFETGDFSFEIILLFGMHLIKLGATLTGVVYMIMNVYAGFQYILGSSMGDKESGTNALTNAFMGFALAVGSWVIMDIFIAFFTT